MRVDLNCDMGESFGAWTMGDDAALLDVVSSASIACGFHAGDLDVMLATVRAAKAKGVAIGAHPSFHDLQGFGRRRMALTAAEIEALVAYQTGALMGVAALAGHRVSHVKPHGALSNMACEDEAIAAAIARAIQRVDPALVFVVLPLTAMERAGTKAGLKLAREVYADRAYADDGTLVPRGQPGAVLHDAAEVAARVAAMVREQAITTVSGRKLAVAVDTVCVHGDTPGAVAIARAVRAGLGADGVTVRAFAG
ncbi:MAG: 5-oxoprolinase subunit PxpA [Xanthobacteraceae bacterium]|nr:MAG: 5-oxoprolinase subunit PxpA [Xanthobacteraceae bacterium]